MFAIIESPYKGHSHEVIRNERYAQLLCRLAVQKGYKPFASHLLYTSFLDDKNEIERELGIVCGLAFGETLPKANTICIVGIDFGLSAGVQRAVEHWEGIGLPIRYVQILNNDSIGTFFRTCTEGCPFELRLKNFDKVIEMMGVLF